MRPEKCPTCGGYCCTGNLFGNKVRHTGERGYEHECLRCSDGYTPPAKPPEHTADTERAAVLAYLRAAYSPNTIVPLPDFLAALLRMVEKGEHHRKDNE